MNFLHLSEITSSRVLWVNFENLKKKIRHADHFSAFDGSYFCDFFSRLPSFTFILSLMRNLNIEKLTRASRGQWGAKLKSTTDDEWNSELLHKVAFEGISFIRLPSKLVDRINTQTYLLRNVLWSDFKRISVATLFTPLCRPHTWWVVAKCLFVEGRKKCTQQYLSTSAKNSFANIRRFLHA